MCVRQNWFACGTAAAAIIGWVVSWPALAEDRPADPVGAARAQQERETARAEQFLSGLQLTPAQAKRLLPSVEKGAELYLRRYETEAELQPEMIEAYTAFAAEDRANEGFSREVEKRTGRVHGREVEAREQLAQELAALEQQAARVLTKEQREWVQSLDGLKPAGRVRRVANSDNERLGALREALRALEARKHVPIGPLGKFLMHPPSYEAICTLAGRQPSEAVRRAGAVYRDGTEACPREQFEERQAELQRLRKEINNWNLINGLYLSREQIDKLVALHEQSRPDAGRAERRNREQASAAIVAAEQAAEEVLNPGQRQVLADYKPCLLPPKNLKDPVRVGQANDGTPYQEWLSHARQKSGEALEQAIDNALEREAKHLGMPTKTERQQREVAMRKVARQAGQMSDSEFELNKESLAERIRPPDRMGELRQEIDAAARAQGEPGRVAQFLLNADFVAQLQVRGEQLAAGVERKPADLAAGPQAENCEKGCALAPKKAKRRSD